MKNGHASRSVFGAGEARTQAVRRHARGAEREPLYDALGRKTPWTPARVWEQGRYRNLPVHNSHSNQHIALSINSGRFYNEDCLLAGPLLLAPR